MLLFVSAIFLRWQHPGSGCIRVDSCQQFCAGAEALRTQYMGTEARGEVRNRRTTRTTGKLRVFSPAHSSPPACDTIADFAATPVCKKAETPTPDALTPSSERLGMRRSRSVPACRSWSKGLCFLLLFEGTSRD